jgi:hypothetical protein
LAGKSPGPLDDALAVQPVWLRGTVAIHEIPGVNVFTSLMRLVLAWKLLVGN